MSIARLRRVALAVFSVALAAALCHGAVASALVTRGDDLMRSGDAGGAVRSYSRAMQLDASSAVAADRLAFFFLIRRAHGDALTAFAIAGQALRRTPRDPALLADRAFAAQRLARWRDAEHGFATVADVTHDPRYLHLAARMAQHAGDVRAARAHLRAALGLDPAYRPARVVLRRIGG